MMTKKRMFIAILAFALSGAANSWAKEYSADPARPHGQMVTAQSLRSFQDMALKGDGDASLGVAMYFFLNQPTKSVADDVQTVQWMQIAAENGNPLAMKLYASSLNAKGGRDNCLRATYWVARALAGLKDRDDLDAAKELQTQIRANTACLR